MASFRGVSFWVKSDKEEYGRRIVHHEFPNADDPFNEDLGEKYKKFGVSGYVVGDTATSDKFAVVAACRLRGAALLQLPAVPAFLAVCVSLNVTRSKDDQGIFELQMEFVADPGIGSPINIPVFESLVSGVMTGIGAALSAYYYATFDTTNTLTYVAANAVSRVQAFADTMTTTIENLAGSSTSDRMTQATTDAIGIFQSAASIAQPEGAATPVDVIATMGDIFYNVMQAAAPADALVAMRPLTTFSVAEGQDGDGAAQYGDYTQVVTYAGATITITNVPAQSPAVHAYTGSTIAPSDTKDAANAAAFNGAVRIYALIAYAQAAAATVFTDIDLAVQTRADLAELFDQQLERTMDEALAIAMINARDYAITAISQTITTIVPLVTVECPISLPSLYWAGRLYNDATRAQELSDRNDVPTPAFMPQQFEALQS
jgi:prophage DNA circulation protein